MRFKVHIKPDSEFLPDSGDPQTQMMIALSKNIKKMDIATDKTYFVSIKEEKPIRSLNQNRYYWGVVLKVLALEFGYSAEEMHEISKQQFNQEHRWLKWQREGIPQAREYSFGGSTKELDTAEFSEYVDLIRGWAASEFQINIPDPNEVTDEIYEQISEKYDKRFY